MQPDLKSSEFWVEGSERFYIDACNMLNYPQVPLGEHFEKIIKPDDTVLDLGCGFGVASVYIANKCKHVHALDSSEKAIGYLNNRIERENIDNITTYCAPFSETKAPKCDVTVMLYVYKLIRNLQMAKEVLDITKREGIILCNHSKEDSGFHEELSKRLGIEFDNIHCQNGCYVKGLFEALGVKTECEQISHEFGQPVKDLDDASEFLIWQLHLGKEYIERIRVMASDYVTQRDGRMYIPYSRKSCILHFVK